MKGRQVLEYGLAAALVGPAAFLWLMWRVLGQQDPADLLAADEVERGGGEPHPRPRGRHRASP